MPRRRGPVTYRPGWGDAAEERGDIDVYQNERVVGSYYASASGRVYVQLERPLWRAADFRSAKKARKWIERVLHA